MPRPPRIDFPEARHHVMNRGARHQPIFQSNAACERFLDILGSVVDRYGIVIYGYALMPNHFHLMVESVRGNLSKAMQNLSFRYSQSFNTTPGFDGALFRGRYRSKLVFDEAHWIYLLGYLHLNPVRAHLAVHPDQYLWTSHGAYCTGDKKPSWLNTKQMQGYFDIDGGYQDFIASLMNHSESPPPDFDDILFESRRGGRHMMVKQPEALPSLSVAEALKQVSLICDSPKSEILKIQRGPGGNPARALAVWWLTHGARKTNTQVGEILKMSPSAVSKILRKIRETPSDYFSGQVSRWCEKLS